MIPNPLKSVMGNFFRCGDDVVNYIKAKFVEQR